MSNADNAWAQAQARAKKDGIGSALPLYLSAADRYADEGRVLEGLTVLAALMAPPEQKRGWFAKKPVDPLGPHRIEAAAKYAELGRRIPPDDDLLESLGILALDFPDHPIVRIANAEKLQEAGYLVDAVEEFKYYTKLVPTDGRAIATLGELYAQLGRPDAAIEQLRRAVAVFTEAGAIDEACAAIERFVIALPTSIGEAATLTARMGSTNQPRQSAMLRAAAQSAAARIPPYGEEREAIERGLAAVQAKLAQIDPTAATVTAGVDHAAAAAPTPRVSAPAATFQMKPEPAISQPGPPAASKPTPPPAAPQPPPQPAAPAPAHRVGSKTASALSGFVRRKAQQSFNAGDLAGALESYERLMKVDPTVEDQRALVRCYAALGRTDDALALGVKIAKTQIDADEGQTAFDTLTWLSSIVPDPEVWSMRSELALKLNPSGTEVKK